jgi:hypothetical protein
MLGTYVFKTWKDEEERKKLVAKSHIKDRARILPAGANLIGTALQTSSTVVRPSSKRLKEQ